MEGRFLKKNVVAVAVIIGILLIGAALVFNTFKNSDENTTTGTLQVNRNLEKIVTQTVSVDSDGDGLKDWEEVLFETDPRNPDTDGDGTDDKDEIDQNRNPLVAGPDDYIEDGVESSTNNEDRTVTEDLAIELFSGYMKLKSGGGLETASSEELITAVINETVKIPIVKTYSTEDIIVVEKPKKEVISRYDIQLTDILKPDPTAESDVVVLKRILETKDSTELVIFDTSMKRYRKIVAEMLLLNVPESVSTEHVNAINALIKITENVKNMKSVFTDPLGALIGVKEYDINERIFVENLLKIGEYLNLNRAS